ncbi:MAG TPA: transcriptional repressor LexA [Holophagaceae bacterium]|nr:transcriptional repressor LexA [Holophagaceae bacterium]
MKSGDLTKRQQAVLHFIRGFLDEEGRSPTLQEVAAGVGSSAVSTIHKHVQHLIDKGFLQRSHGKGNNLVVTSLGRETRDAAPERAERLDRLDRNDRLDRTEPPPAPMRLIPFCGEVAAGTPILPETRAVPIEVPNTIHRNKDEVFVLRVKGDSMVEDAILDGDLVVLQRKGEYRNGDRVVALLDGEEVTLKEFKRDSKGVWLIPHNPALKPKCYTPDRVEIQGLLVGVMRSC